MTNTEIKLLSAMKEKEIEIRSETRVIFFCHDDKHWHVEDLECNLIARYQMWHMAVAKFIELEYGGKQ